MSSETMEEFWSGPTTPSPQTPYTILWMKVTPRMLSSSYKNSKVSVYNIMTSAGGTGRKFIIIGDDAEGEPVVFGLDLTPVQPRVCVAADYEEWTPSDGNPGKSCVLGRSVTYLRRKRDAECYNNNPDHLVSSNPCDCTASDWECDFGFQPTPYNGTFACALSGDLPQDPPSYCPPGTTYTVSRGYRKVAGDTCTKGLDLSPTIKKCPDSSSLLSSSKAWVAVLIVVLVVAAIGVGAFFGYRNETVRTKVSGFFTPILAKIRASSGDQRYSRVGVRPGSLADEEFGIGGDGDGDGDGDLEDDSLEDEEGAKELGDNDITDGSHGSEFDPRK